MGIALPIKCPMQSLANCLVPTLLFEPSYGSNDQEVQPLKKKPPGLSLWHIPIGISTRISLCGNGLKIQSYKAYFSQFHPLYFLCLLYGNSGYVPFDRGGKNKEITEYVTATTDLLVIASLVIFRRILRSCPLKENYKFLQKKLWVLDSRA